MWESRYREIMEGRAEGREEEELARQTAEGQQRSREGESMLVRVERIIRR